MVVDTPQLMFSKVMHKRLTPRVNGFTYGVYYVMAPVSSLSDLLHGRVFGVNRWGLLSLYEKDYGPRDGAPLERWIKNILKEQGLEHADGEIYLVTMPRVFGYAFNPVSFWMCFDKAQKLRAVLCEVNNTFGEHHFYLCSHEDQTPITADDWLEAEKLFHVSPFLEREGHYKFRFACTTDNTGIWIDYYDSTGSKKLLTAVTGKMAPLAKKTAFKALAYYPFLTVKVITLIHWQAIKLWFKRIRYVPKPLQIKSNFSKNRNVTDL